jgi:hypothetical protein
MGWWSGSSSNSACLASGKCETMSSNPSATKKGKKKKRIQDGFLFLCLFLEAPKMLHKYEMSGSKLPQG